jgi:hypothetical protein
MKKRGLGIKLRKVSVRFVRDNTRDQQTLLFVNIKLVSRSE